MAVVIGLLEASGPALRSRIYAEAQGRAIADGAQLLFAGVEPSSGDSAGRTIFAMSFPTAQAAEMFAASVNRGLFREVVELEPEVVVVDAWTPTIGESPVLIEDAYS